MSRCSNQQLNGTLYPMAKKTRRGNAEGSVYFDETVSLWRGSVSLGHKLNQDGKTVRARRTVTGKTRKEADEKLTAIKQSVAQGLPVGDSSTVGDLLLKWLDSVKETIRPKTYRSYEQMVRNHLAPLRFEKAERKKHAMEAKAFPDLGLAKIKLAKLSIADVNKFLTAKLAGGNSAALVRYLRVVLRAALAYGERSDLVARNVAKLSSVPKDKSNGARRAEIEPFTLEQVKQLREALRGHRLEVLFGTALAIGLRHGEALGLQWADLDEQTATLRVFYQLQKVDGRLERVPTKSEKSRRVVHLPDFCVKSLIAHAERQEQDRELAGHKWQETGYVFTSGVGTPLLERNVLRDFTAVLKKTGLPKRRIHDLRHSFVSLLAAEGVPLKTIAEIVGHSDIRLTQNIYQHVFSEEKKDAARAMDRVLRSQG